jgi:hypothetical protein
MKISALAGKPKELLVDVARLRCAALRFRLVALQ